MQSGRKIWEEAGNEPYHTVYVKRQETMSSGIKSRLSGGVVRISATHTEWQEDMVKGGKGTLPYYVKNQGIMSSGMKSRLSGGVARI